MKKYIILFISLFMVYHTDAKTIIDSEAKSIHALLKNSRAKYVIRNFHQFKDTLYIPQGCYIFFEGGGLSGPIVFDDTKLGGQVNLRGSSISGSIRNKIFDASWLCYMDGITDDAPRINEMIEVCGNVFFPKGDYRLISAFNTDGKLPKELHSSVNGHIAICKSNVTLDGETGATFITESPLITLCIFSQPNKISESISNIIIRNMAFDVHNDGKNFQEFMHTIKLIGVNGITIKDCTFNDFWGDAICLSQYGDVPQTGERTRNQNVKILNNTIIGGSHHNNRNGISVINGKNVLVKGNTIKNTSRKNMPGGIDVEPNNSAYTIDNIRIEGNVFEGIRGNCGAIEVCMFDGGPGHNIFIENNTIRDCNRGLYVYLMTDNTTDNFVIRNNYVAEDTPPYKFVGSGRSKNWIITGNTFGRPCRQIIPGDIKVENLVVKNKKK